MRHAKRERFPIMMSMLVIGVVASLILISQSLRASADQELHMHVLGSAVKQQSRPSAKEEFEKIKAQYPKVDYDSPEPTDPAERMKRHNKGKHFDNGYISKKPTRYSSVLSSHWDVGLSALPVEQSSAVLLASTVSRGAFLSNDRSGVYTELSVRVEQVLKGDYDQLSENCIVDINRVGGVVHYSSGEESLFSIEGQNIPVVGKRYLFFLKAIPDSVDFEIITGYELSASRVKALDSPAQFAQFDGLDEMTFLTTVRNAIAQKKQQ